MTVRVLIADDQALVRGSFRLLVESASDLTVVGEAGTGAEALAMSRSERPDVVVMDVRMPEMDGIEATRLICADPELGAVRVLMLTTFDLDEYVYAALRAGASGFLLKDAPPATLLTGIRSIAAGEGMLAPTVTKRLIEEFTLRPEGVPAPRRLDALTGREREVLTLIAKGLSNTELAAALFVSMATVKTHISRLLAKLQARDRAQLVIAAYESGLVTAGPPPKALPLARQGAVEDLAVGDDERVLAAGPRDAVVHLLHSGWSGLGAGQELGPEAHVAGLALQDAVDEGVLLGRSQTVRVGDEPDLVGLFGKRLGLGRGDRPGPGEVGDVFERAAGGGLREVDERHRDPVSEDHIVRPRVMVAHHVETPGQDTAAGRLVHRAQQHRRGPHLLVGPRLEPRGHLAGDEPEEVRAVVAAEVAGRAFETAFLQ